MALSSFFARKGLKLLRSAGDGHCLLHSIVSSWNSQLAAHKPISIDSVKADVFIETLNNADLYDPFIGGRLPHLTGLRRCIIDRLKTKILVIMCLGEQEEGASKKGD